MKHKTEIEATVYELISHAKKSPIDAFEIVAKLEDGFDVTARLKGIENIEHHRAQSISLTVYQESRSSTVSTSDFSTKALEETLVKACSLVRYAEADPYAGLADKTLLAFNYPDLQLYHPWEITPQAAAELAIACEEGAQNYDTRISQVEEAYLHTGSYYRVYANSDNFFGGYPGSFHGLQVSVIASENGQMERDHDSCYARSSIALDSPIELGRHAAKRAVERLGARKISTRRCPVIFERRVASSLLRHFISAISGRNLYQHHSFLLDSLGKQIFPSFVNIYQRPHLLGGYGSLPFDGEGVMTRDLDYVVDGVVTNYVLAAYSSRKLGMTSTGNASGVHNLFITPGPEDLAALCAKIGTGLLVTELMGQGVHILTGNYSRGASGFWIENGLIQYPVHEITIGGNLSDMFAHIIGISNDIEHRSNIVTGSIAVEEMVIAGA